MTECIKGTEWDFYVEDQGTTDVVHDVEDDSEKATMESALHAKDDSKKASMESALHVEDDSKKASIGSRLMVESPESFAKEDAELTSPPVTPKRQAKSKGAKKQPLLLQTPPNEEEKKEKESLQQDSKENMVPERKSVRFGQNRVKGTMTLTNRA